MAQTSIDIIAEIEKETTDEAAAQLKALLRATGEAIRERKVWQARRQKEIDELTEVQVNAVKWFDAGTFDADAQRESKLRVFKIKHRAQPITEAERQRRKEEAIARYRERRGFVVQAVNEEDSTGNDD